MRCCSRNKMRQAIVALAVMGLSLAGRTVPVRADALSYASSARQIKACVLVSNAATFVTGGVTIPENAVPYVFYMLDRRTDLKPSGWSFVNPLASSTVTTAIRERWIARDTTAIDASLANPVFALGAPLTKNIGAYWEVNLDTVSQTALQQFDIVLMAYHTAATGFSPNERDMLRKYVDAGGTVWLEDEGGFDIQSGGNHFQNQFVVDTAFNGPVVAAANLPSLATFHHPLVNFPFPISSTTVQALGAGSIGVHHIAVDPIAGPVDSRVVVPVIWSGAGVNNRPLVYAGDYGAGHIVISSTGIATDINSYAGGSKVANENGNSGAVSGENTLGVQLTDAEFAINMMAWTSTVSTGAFSARRTGSSQEDIGFGLNTRWNTVPTAVAPSTADSGSAIYKSCVFYVDGYNTLHAYDLMPGESLNDNNLPDDGIPDFTKFGSPYDEIWNVNLVGLGGTGFKASTRFGTPTLFSIINNGAIIDELAVQGSNGVTAVFNAFTANPNGTLAAAPALLYTIVGSGGNNAGDFGPALQNQHGGQFLSGASPAYSDGVLFSLVYDSQSGAFNDTNDAWRVFPTDPITGQNVFGNAFVKLGVAPTPQQLGLVPLLGMAMPIGSPNVGYVTDYTTGAQDKIVYVSTLPDENITTNGNGGAVNAELFCVKNDPLQDVFNTQYALAGPIPAVQFSAFRANLNRGNIPWFLPPLPWNGSRALLPVCHRTTGGVNIDLVYDPTGASANSFKVEYPIDPTSTNNANQLHQIWVIPNQPLLPGDTITADYTVDWPAASIPDQTGTPIQPISQNFAYPFASTFIRNPLGASPGVGPMFFTGATTLSSDDMLFANVGDAPYADRMYALNVHFQVGNATVQGSSRPEGMAVRWMFYPNGPIPDENLPTGSQGVQARLVNSDTFGGLFVPNLSNPLIATDLESVGAPAVSNGVVYQTGWAHMHFPNAPVSSEWNAAIIMAYQANPPMSFTVRDSDGNATQLPVQATNNANNTNGNNTSSPLTISQVDLINYVPGTLPTPVVTLTQNLNFSVDPATNAITIFDCKSARGESFNICEPFSVYQTSGIRGQAPLGAPLQLNAAGHSVLDNLLWWMLIPMQNLPGTGLQADNHAPPVYGLADPQPAGGPSVIGSTLYYGTEHGYIMCVDLSNMPQDGSQAMLFRSDGTPRAQMTPALFDTTTQTAVNLPVISPPVGTTDVVVSSSPKGITALDNGLTLIATADRLLEVDHLVNAKLSIDSTQTQKLVGGPLANTGQFASTKISLARPSKAIHDTVGSFVVADSGNNRVMETDAGGIVTWEIHSFNDGMQFLRHGDPLTLNHPTDVQLYTLAGNGTIAFTSKITNNTYSYTGSYYSVHYLVADSGNFRAIEIVDVYDANGVPIVMTSPGQPAVTMLRQLVFVTQTLSEQNKSLRYRTVQQFVDPTGTLYQASVVDNDAVGGVDITNPTQAANPPPADAPGGAVLIVKRTGGLDDGTLVSKITGLYDPNQAVGFQHNKISGPTFFKEYTAITGQVHYLLCDANGCYDLAPPTALNPVPGANNGEAVVTWALYTLDYQSMTGRPLKAASMERLGKADYNLATNLFYPHYLITNRYTGDDNVVNRFGNGVTAPLLQNVSNGQIRGEVFEVRGDVYYNKIAYPNGYQTSGLNGAALYVNLGGFLNPQNPATSAITWMAPKETFFQTPSGNPPAIKRSIGSLSTSGTFTYLLEQPSFSDRPY